MILSDSTTRMIINVLEDAATDDREPERYRRWYARALKEFGEQAEDSAPEVNPKGGPPPGVHPEDWDAVPALPGLDPGIAPIVRVLRAHGVETCESCEGGPGHAGHGPYVHVQGATVAAGWHALSVALSYGYEPQELGRVWRIDHGAPMQPVWRLTFRAEDARS